MDSSSRCGAPIEQPILGKLLSFRLCKFPNSGTASRISGDIRHVALEKEDETELDDPGQHQQNKRDGERELDRGHAALTAPTRAHNAQRRSHGSE